jgi:tRNA-specific 2-thiouridylase
MSGGVDSTMAACLLKDEGVEVVGVTMRIGDGSVSPPGRRRSGCYGAGEPADLARAAEIAARLGIAHHVVPLGPAYERIVLEYFRREYLAGRTPNPCIVCNHRIKFGLLIEEARAAGMAFDAFATGHYARVAQDARGVSRLFRGRDREKDQSYFLFRLEQRQLAQLILPLGDLTKAEVVRRARERGFGDLADGPESQDFASPEDFAAVFHGAPVRPGPITDREGRVVGQHRGLVHYTIGQRAGLGVCAGTRLYVQALRPQTNTVVVGRRDEVMSRECRVEAVHWIAGPPRDTVWRCEVRIRYRSTAAPATVRVREAGRADVAFDDPQFAVTPGQAAVFYAGDEVLGGGWIGGPEDAPAGQNRLEGEEGGG